MCECVWVSVWEPPCWLSSSSPYSFIGNVNGYMIIFTQPKQETGPYPSLWLKKREKCYGTHYKWFMGADYGIFFFLITSPVCFTCSLFNRDSERSPVVQSSLHVPFQTINRIICLPVHALFTAVYTHPLSLGNKSQRVRRHTWCWIIGHFGCRLPCFTL